MNTSELLARLKRHYIKPGEPLPGGAFLAEVACGRASRRVDALYVGFTSSRGHHINGHELKVSRSDWLHELDQIDKAEWWFTHTHRWWLVTCDPSVAKPEELPPGWGLMIASARTTTRMDIVVKADLREPLIDFDLLFELIKKQDTQRAAAVRDAVDKTRREATESLDKARAAGRIADPRHLAAFERLQELEAVTGIQLGAASFYDKSLVHADHDTAVQLVREFFRGEAHRREVIKSSEDHIGRIRNQAAGLNRVLEEQVSA